MELVGLVVAFAVNFNHVMKVSFRATFKLNVEFDGQASSNISNVFVVAAEVRSLRLRELEALKVLSDVADGNSHFVVLVWLNV